MLTTSDNWTTSRRLAMRVADHWRRARREGFRRTLREDAFRAGDAIRSNRWRMAHRLSPNAVPVYVVGIQRSGTDMVIEALRRCPAIEVHNESRDSRAFCDFKLRDDVVIRKLIRDSNHRCVAFKSLSDSHRVIHLMEGLGVPSKGRAIWVVRSMEGRVRSTLAKWPENNRRVLRQIASGERTSLWEAQGLSTESIELIETFDYDAMSQASAAALLWFVRNSLYYDLGLDGRDDVALVRYEQVLTTPGDTIRSLCEFLSVPYNDRMSAHIGTRPPATRGALDIDPVIRARCEDLEARFASDLPGEVLSAGSLSA